MNTNEKLREKRTALGLSENEVAQLSGMSIHEYSDLEHHADEFTTVLSLGQARRVCEALQVDLLDLLGIAATVGDHQPRHKTVKIAREARSMSTAQLAEILGFEEWVIERLEAEPDYLESLPIDFVTGLAEALDVSAQSLLRRSKQ